MATTGRAAYVKYFNFGKEIATTLKKDSPKYGANDSKTEGSVKKGTVVTYINEGEYQSKALVREDNNLYRVKFDSLTKPGSKASSRVDLKPQSFGIKEVEYNFDQLYQTALNTLEERTDLRGPVKGYLQLLLAYHAEGEQVTTQQLIEAYQGAGIDGQTQKGIINDFGELLGPFAVYRDGLIDKATNGKVKVPQSAKSYFPSRPNEPLMDYGIYIGSGSNKKLLTVSAKALSKSTNVVKPPDIIMLLKRKENGNDGQMFRKYKNSIQMKVLEILSENSIKNGPILAAAHFVDSKPSLARKYPGLSIDAAKNIVKMGDGYDPTLFTTFFETNEAIKKRPTAKINKKPTHIEIMYACEKILSAESKNRGPLTMHEIFADAIAQKVYYVKFMISSTGVPQWAIQLDSDFRQSSNVFLRTKNGYTRASDRMGVQP
tara:strand:- start:5593 stop:6885 length:1293 start_codon:yes stop_codon:yes gene_type:complete